MTAEATVKEWLEQLTDADTSSEEDGIKMQNLMRSCDFPGCVVTCGIVYLEGRGTIEAPPTSIHSIAKMLLKV